MKDPRQRVRELEERLAADDARGTRRAEIAQIFVDLGDADAAAKWFLEAARHAEWSEIAFVPLTWTKKAVEVAPNNLDAWREYKRQWARAGMTGEPPKPGTT